MNTYRRRNARSEAAPAGTQAPAQSTLAAAPARCLIAATTAQQICSVVTRSVAVGETVILLMHPPLPLAGVSIWMERGCGVSKMAVLDGG